VILFWVAALALVIPFGITIDQVASPPASLHFMFWGAGIVVLPLTLGYTLIVYRVFGGKLVDRAEDY
jgi:cytochrome d ubiquinol oxidase subunit II